MTRGSVPIHLQAGVQAWLSISQEEIGTGLEDSQGRGAGKHPEATLERTRREIRRHCKGEKEGSRGHDSCLQNNYHVNLDTFSGSPRRNPREMGSGYKEAGLQMV